MTQSLFTRLRVPSPLTTTLRHGNKISGTCWVSVASPGFTCRDSKQASCIFSSGLHTHRAQGRLVTQGISDLIPVAWINALIIVCLINDHHLSACVGVCVLCSHRSAVTLQASQTTIRKKEGASHLLSHKAPAQEPCSPWPWRWGGLLSAGPDSIKCYTKNTLAYSTMDLYDTLHNKLCSYITSSTDWTEASFPASKESSEVAEEADVLFCVSNILFHFYSKHGWFGITAKNARPA